MIEVESLSKLYGKTLAVDDISFQIRKGEVVGMLGPNGAGKTTTMKILTTFLPASSGKVRIAGHDVFAEPLEIKKLVGYLPETCPLYLDMEVSAYLKFCAEVRGIEPGKRKNAVDRVIQECNLKAVIYKMIGHLSKGYRQRVGLAQALIHNPSILILDEPTSGLDPNQIREILNLINNLGQEKTVIHSTHILSEVEKTSDRVLIINEGKIVGQGTPAELMAQASGTTVYVTAKGSAVQEALGQADFVKDVSKVGDGEGDYVRLALHGNEQNGLAEKTFKLAVDKGWTLQELTTRTASLEDVFTRLTKG